MDDRIQSSSGKTFAPYAGIGTKIAALMCILAATSLVTMGIVPYRRFHSLLMQEKIAQLTSEATIASVRFGSRIDAARDDVRFLAGTPPIQGIIRASQSGGTDPIDGSTQQVWQQRLQTIFTKLLTAKPQYLEAHYISLENDGHEVVHVERVESTVRTNAALSSLSNSQRDYCQRAIQLASDDVLLSDIKLNRRNQVIVEPHIPVLRAGIPIHTPSGELFGIVVIHVDLRSYLQELVDGTSRGHTLYLANDAGHHLLHPNPQRCFGFEFNRPYRITNEFSNFEFSGTHPAGIVQTQTGDRRAIGAHNLYFDPLKPNRFLTFVAAASYGKVVADALGTRNQTIAVGLGLLLAALVAAFVLSRSLTMPLRQMVEGVRKFQEGDAQVVLPVDAKDEAGVLARSFDAMIKEVRQRTKMLESQIAERKEAQERFQIVVESSPNALVMVDHRGTITLVNERVEQWFGYARQELIGQPIETLVPNRFRLEHPPKIAAYLSNPTSRPMGAGRDLCGERKDGTEFPVEIGLVPITTGHGTMVLASVVDITERKEHERHLNEHAAHLETLTDDLTRRNADLDEFTYVASHDLQEPLRKLISFSALLQKDVGPDISDNAQRDLKFITEAAHRMQNLVQDLLALSRTGRVEIDMQPVSMQSCAQRAIEALDTRIQESGAQISSDDLSTVHGDTTLLTQLYQNLIGNAIKYCNGQPVIHLTLEQGQDGLIFGLRDNGIGIKPEYHDQIFAPFKRLHGRGQYEGTGVGLATCRKVVERHGGTIWVESQPGQGSHFKFTLGTKRKAAA